jgi:hypothetical protein
MKLWKVRITHDLVVRASSEVEARSLAVESIRDLTFDEELTTNDAAVIHTLDDLPPEWDGDCRPYGHRDPYDRTIRQQLERPLD